MLIWIIAKKNHSVSTKYADYDKEMKWSCIRYTGTTSLSNINYDNMLNGEYFIVLFAKHH